MQLLSSTTIFISLFQVFMIYQFYQIWEIVQPPICTDERLCFKSFLLRKPTLELNIFFSPQREPQKSELFYVNSFILPDYNVPFKRMMTVKIPKLTKRNGTLFAHVVLSKAQEILSSGDKWTTLLNDSETVYTLVPMSIYLKPKHEELQDGKHVKKDVKAVTHVKTVLPVSMLTEPLNLSRVHMKNKRLIKKNQEYLPIFLHHFLRDKTYNVTIVDKNTSHVPILLHYEPLSYAKLSILKEIKLAMIRGLSLGHSNYIIDAMKSNFDAHHYLIFLYFYLSCIQAFFDLLAIKNDILFWNSKKSMAGISSRCVLWRAFSCNIIVLYMLEQNVSLLHISPSIIKSIIEFWKVFKVIPVDWKNLKFKKFNRNSAEKNTEKFDAESMKYLSYVIYPLCAVLAVDLFLYEPQKSWYSKIIYCLRSGVNEFGFIFMFPQIFINYKIKSVAHLPWITLIYEALSIIIDDLLTFILPMPASHQFACLRDGAVYLIYIFQRWCFPVDRN